MYTGVFILLMLLAFNTCDEEIIDEEQKVIDDKEFVNELLEKSTDSLKIGSNVFILEAYLWRDFQPISPPEGRPMIASNSLIEVNTDNIPQNIDLVKQYVIKDESVWKADYDDSSPHSPGFKIEKISRDGPKWEPGTKVIIVCKVTDKDAGVDYFIRKDDVEIKRTD